MAKKASAKKAEQESSIITAEDLELFNRMKPGDMAINGKIISAAEIDKQIKEDDSFRQYMYGSNRLLYHQNEVKRGFAFAKSSAECLVQLESSIAIQAGLQELASYPVFQGLNLLNSFEAFLNWWKLYYQNSQKKESEGILKAALGMGPATIVAGVAELETPKRSKQSKRDTFSRKCNDLAEILKPFGYNEQRIRQRIVRAEKKGVPAVIEGVEIRTHKFSARERGISSANFQELRTELMNKKKEDRSFKFLPSQR